MVSIGIDAVRLSKKRTGIENVALSILKCLPTLVKKHPNWNFTIFSTKKGLSVYQSEVGEADQSQLQFRIIPDHKRGWPKEQLVLPFVVGTSKKLDIFYSPGYPISPFIFSRKLVIQVHDMVPWRFQETMTAGASLYWRTLLPYSIKRAHTIFVPSKFTARELEFFGFDNKKNIHVLNDAIDNRFLEFCERDNTTNIIQKLGIKQPYVLVLGSLEPRKNVPFLLDVFERYMDKELNHDLNLVIAGGKGWKNQEIYNQIYSHKYKENIILAGWVPDNALPHIVAGAKALLFPSIYEGFGLPPLEAIALKTPAIVSNAASLPEVLGHHAFFAELNKTDDWVLQMQQVINNNAYKGREESGKKWAAKYSQENFLFRIENLLLTIISD